MATGLVLAWAIALAACSDEDCDGSSTCRPMNLPDSARPDGDASRPTDANADADAGQDGDAPSGCIDETCGGHGQCMGSGPSARCLCELAAQLVGNACVPRDEWFGIDGSELGPYATPLALPQTIVAAGSNPELAAAADGTLVVAYESPTGIGARSWDGTRWADLGTPDSVTAIGATGSSLDVAIDASAVYLAYVEDGTPRVRKWTGSMWQGLGGSDAGTPFGDADSVGIAVGSDGAPVIAYDRAGITRVARWSGSAWVGFGGSELPGGVDGIPSGGTEIGLDSMDRPVIFGGTTLRRWDGGAWSTPVVLSTAESSCSSGAFAIEASDAALVACWYHVTTSTVAIRATRVAPDGTTTVLPSPRTARLTTIALASDPASGEIVIGSAAYDGAGASLELSRLVDDEWTFPDATWTSPVLDTAFDVAHLGARGIVLAIEDGDAIRVQRHAGIDWENLGEDLATVGLSRTRAPAHDPQLRMDAAGHIVAGWVADVNGAPQIHVRSLRDGAWQDHPPVAPDLGPDASDRPPFVFDLAIDSEGRPAVGWHDARRSRDAIAQWTGSAWVVRDGPESGNLLSTTIPNRTAIAFDADDAPWIASTRYESGYRAQLHRWSGADWIEVGADSRGSDRGNAARHLVIDRDGRAYATFFDDGALLQVARIDGSGWEYVRHFVNGTSAESPGTLALDSSGAPWFAALGFETDTGIHVRHLEGAMWSTSPDPIPRTNGTGSHEVLTLNGDVPLVAWENSEAPNSGEIYAWTLRGMAWAGIANGSIAGGVSNSEARSQSPSIATRDHLVCIAWSERRKIALRCAHP